MKLSIKTFAARSVRSDVVIHSLDQALYQVTVIVDGAEYLLVDESGRAIRHRNLQAVREMLQVLPVAVITLRQDSAYDEMIGQPPRGRRNTLEVTLSPLRDTPATLH